MRGQDDVHIILKAKLLGYKIQFSKVLWTNIQYGFYGLISVISAMVETSIHKFSPTFSL